MVALALQKQNPAGATETVMACMYFFRKSLLTLKLVDCSQLHVAHPQFFSDLGFFLIILFVFILMSAFLFLALIVQFLELIRFRLKIHMLSLY